MPERSPTDPVLFSGKHVIQLLAMFFAPLRLTSENDNGIQMKGKNTLNHFNEMSFFEDAFLNHILSSAQKRPFDHGI